VARFCHVTQKRRYQYSAANGKGGMMGNMPYCRFRNTLIDLYDCYAYLNEEVSEEENTARKKLIILCQDIARQTDGEEG